jgi:hypothetical protein
MSMPIRKALILSCASLLLLGLAAPSAHAQQSGREASPLATTVPDSSATEVFVLGSVHLSNVADQFEPSMIDSLMTALNAFAPQAIAVERLPGRQVAAMERWGGRLDEVNERYAGSFLHHGHLVREQADWSWSKANQRADSLLAMARSDSLAFGAENRLSLIRSLTASYRLASAALQWRYLSSEDRSSQTLLPDTTARWLNSRLDAATETQSIGTRLAYRRGHQRVYPMDYQAEHDLMVDIDTLYSRVMKSVEKEVMSDPTIKRTFSLQKSGLESGSLLPLYRHMNTEEWGRDRVDVHWKELLRRSTPENVGPARVAIYETRNLHMVGHIQRMIAQHPGERVLVVVGGSHKPLFDAYLRQMMGVKVVDAEEVIPGM